MKDRLYDNYRHVNKLFPIDVMTGGNWYDSIFESDGSIKEEIHTQFKTTLSRDKKYWEPWSTIWTSMIKRITKT